MYTDIYGSAKFLINFEQAFKDYFEELGGTPNYGLHPVTAKPMNKTEFYHLAKEQNWNDIEIYNNLAKNK